MQENKYLERQYKYNFEWHEDNSLEERGSLIKDLHNDDLGINTNDLEENLAGSNTPPSTRMSGNPRIPSLPDPVNSASPKQPH